MSFVLLPALLPPLLGWLACRRVARAAGTAALWLDLLFPLGLPLLLLGLTGLPWLSGVLAGLPLAGLALADATKRAVLQEPVVFSDAAMLPLVVRHPGLYLPFAGTGWVLGGAALGAAVLAVLAGLEPVALRGTPRVVLAVLGLGLLLLLLVPPARLRAALAREPFADTRRFGTLATLALFRAVAWAERPARRAAFPAAALRPAAPAPHVVLVQMESFWDPRGTLPGAPPLPNWDRLAAAAIGQGRLRVPGFGANTMRAEFAVLTGIGEGALGLDRFNPYFRFARAGLRSLPGGLAAAGYATVALHPFDRRFFGRHRVLPALGFGRFVAAAGFAGAPRAGGYVADAAVAARILDELRAAPGPALAFAITMQAHGPWPGHDPRAQWLGHLRDADAMLGLLADAAPSLGRPLVLCAYGDHLPALPDTAGLGDRRSSWLLWRSDAAGAGARRDIGAEELFHALGAALTGQPWRPAPADPT
ncbi:LTA synthase family protein [Roseomonas haemaphysalidis]|uniref:LTA synthase family protein n=1 Tax=Roseomonas haemaphysalidis TaxID=2768162 RepID=A0ABS3KPR0_9PROT|nr:LTA synthase family protein [Roseomonas haemaphysalidis]MBO1078588.1 LTA synthase family protein [Roseomonas haemaphysalidis]